MTDWPVKTLPSIEAALRDLSSGSENARLQAVTALSAAPEERRADARRALARALDDASAKVRAQAALALAELGPGEALDQLIALVDDPDGGVAQAAVIALGESEAPATRATLEAALSTGEADVRFQAVLALARVAGREAIDSLERAAGDSDAEVRANVAAALADIDDDRGLPLLERLLADGDEQVRFEAAMALTERGDRQVIPVLLDALGDQELAPQAVRALGQLRAAEAREPLAALADRWTTRAPLRAAAAAALAALGDPKGVEQLDQWLRVRRREPRAMAIYAAGQLRIEPVVERLMSMLEDKGHTDRDAIANALGQIGAPRARDALTRATSDPDPDVAAEAAAALEALDASS